LGVEQFLLLKLFLDNMITTAVFLLIILSVILIYSLMISDVDDKTYEFGMLRALGLEKSSLVLLIIMQGLFFAIPGMTLGTLFAYLLNSIIAYLFFDMSQEVLSYELHYTAIILAFSLGFFIPLISNYIPI
jgi:ABC-type antimicrobial peptide transport system permease subunit